MRTFEEWMDEYAVSHQNPTNQLIHKIFVPLIMLSVLGILWSIPSPTFFVYARGLNWATLFVIFALSFYYRLNRLMFVGMMIQTTLMLIICAYVATTGYLLHASIGVFVISWIFQFCGHKIEGKKPSFATDLAFLLIGPLWVQRFVFAKIGLKV